MSKGIDRNVFQHLKISAVQVFQNHQFLFGSQCPGRTVHTIYHVNRVNRIVWNRDLKPNRIKRTLATVCNKKPNRTVAFMLLTCVARHCFHDHNSHVLFRPGKDQENATRQTFITRRG